METLSFRPKDALPGQFRCTAGKSTVTKRSLRERGQQTHGGATNVGDFFIVRMLENFVMSLIKRLPISREFLAFRKIFDLKIRNQILEIVAWPTLGLPQQL